MFADRTDAGRRLALSLAGYKDKNPVVLGIPRGGVEVAYQVATHLDATLSLIIARKLPLPDNPEAGFGAVAEDGSTFTFPHMARLVPPQAIDEIVRNQRNEIHRRVKTLRQGKPLPELKDRTVIVVDDGIAMGSTMRVSIMLCKNHNAAKVIVAAPVAGRDTAEEIGRLVDETYILKTPPDFRAVAQVYLNWYDLDDEEVLVIMQKYSREKHAPST